jgi:hypothetical protein
MEKQEVFEKVSRHLFEQGEPSMGSIGVLKNACLYRNPKGLKCAIGCLIPDDKYKDSLENTSASSPDIYNLFGGKEVDSQLYGKLQGLHDAGTYYLKDTGKVVLSAWDTSNSMRQALTYIGQEFNLSLNFLADLKFKDK